MDWIDLCLAIDAGQAPPDGVDLDIHTKEDKCPRIRRHRDTSG